MNAGNRAQTDSGSTAVINLIGIGPLLGGIALLVLAENLYIVRGSDIGKRVSYR